MQQSIRPMVIILISDKKCRNVLVPEISNEPVVVHLE
jgi:hypothetical protein